MHTGCGWRVGCRLAVAGMLAAATFAWLVGCASLPPFTPPSVSVASVSLDRIEGADAYFSIDVRLANPNARDLYVASAGATLAIEGEPVAQANLVAPLTLAAHASANATLGARAGMDAVLRAIAAAMRRGLSAAGRPLPPMRYAIDGAAVVSGARIPFRREGDLAGTSSGTP
ncbi:MAG TPA: LEA type 2 family protein [Casimicrobiaceae bacterium]|nr:LEA type 2 family protein [Casimicrobiaceae bacterium]